jgi:hypothetical protein
VAAYRSCGNKMLQKLRLDTLNGVEFISATYSPELKEALIENRDDLMAFESFLLSEN